MTSNEEAAADSGRDAHAVQSERLTRRSLLQQAGRTGFGIATASTLATWLAGCASTSSGVLRATPTSTPQPTVARPTNTPDTRPVTIAITGDIMLGRSVNTQLMATNDRFPFNDTADYLRGFDLTVGNLECVVSTLGAPIPGKQYTFEGNPRGFDRLAAAGFDITSVANNHSGDYGKSAFTDMLAHLPKHGIMPLGGGHNYTEAHQPVIRAIRSTTVGFLAYCEIEPNAFAATATTPGHAWLEATAVQRDIKAVRPRVDYLIVFMHWGIEYQPMEDGQQQAMARLAIDAGADFVVGAHPHVIQPNEKYHGKPIVYSLGNFVFDKMYSEDVRTGQVLALTVQGSQLLHWTLRRSHIGDYGQPSWL